MLASQRPSIQWPRKNRYPQRTLPRCLHLSEFRLLSILDHSTFPGMRNIILTIFRIRKLLKNKKPYKAAGPDALSSHLLRDLAPQLSCPICIRFLQCYDTGAIPPAWRDTLVYPIHKKVSKHDPRIHRPVSLTSIICRLQEHIIVSSMLIHLEDHGILNPDQHGFHSCLSTETQLIQAVHDRARTNDAKGQTDVLFLDFSKTFDTVPHRWLLKLQHLLLARLATGLLLYCMDIDKEWFSMELARPGHQCSQACPRAQWSGPYYSPSTSMTPPAASTHECDSLLMTTSSTEKSIAFIDHWKLQNDITKLQSWSERWQMT